MKTSLKLLLYGLLALLSILSSPLSTLFAQGTAFTYQGRLNENGAPANGLYDLEFRVFDMLTGGSQQGSTVNGNDTGVTNGLFTVTLDPGAGVFTGAARWLNIAVRPGLSLGAYTNVVPRQPITATPYAIKAANAMTVDQGTISNPSFIGTTTTTPLNLFVNNQRGLRLEYASNSFDRSVNVLGGYSGNFVSNGVVGATIGGGGTPTLDGTNRVLVDFGTIGGGFKNTVSGGIGVYAGTVGGGEGNTASGKWSTVGGGHQNVASSFEATISGGNGNTASASDATVSGGRGNVASGTYATVGGGFFNSANGIYATIPGGRNNTATNNAFAAGTFAKAVHTGAFVWADSQSDDFVSTANNQFLIRAAGGVVIGTNTSHASNPGMLEIESGEANNPGLRLSSVGPGHGSGLWFENRSGGTAKTWAMYADTVGGLHLGYQTTLSDVLYLGTNLNVGIGTTSPSGKLHVNGTLRATSFIGDGSGLTGVTTTTNASQLTSGTLFDARLSANVALRSGGNAFSGNQLITAGTDPTIKLQSDGVDEVSGRVSLRQSNDTGYDFYYDGNGAVEGLVLESFTSGTPTTKAMVLKLNGNVGIGTTTPAGRLSVSTVNGMVSIADDQVAPALVMSGGLAPGVLRVRNALEIWPNTDTTTAGKLDVRGTNGAACITLDGANGEVTTVAVNITSDRNAKERFKPVNARDVLAKVARLPISEWQYKEHSDARHIGPMAQDFHAAFAVGRDEKHITTVDADGVALAAIQGLNEKMEEKDAELSRLKSENQSLAGRLAAIERAMGLREQSVPSAK